MILIFMHMDDGSPGYIADYLLRKSVPFKIVRAYAGDTVPSCDDGISGLVFMGGIMSVNDELPWIKEEIRLIKEALDKEIPVLGHCLGGQLISKALGQDINQNPVNEVGWHNCHLTTEAKASNLAAQWLGNISDPFIMFHWHNETFSLPAGAHRLFSSEYCANQAYVFNNNVLAMQCHVEMTLPLIKHWITEWQEDLLEASPSEQNFAQISKNLEQHVIRLNQVAENLYACWVSKIISRSCEAIA